MPANIHQPPAPNTAMVTHLPASAPRPSAKNQALATMLEPIIHAGRMNTPYDLALQLVDALERGHHLA
jgi:hypothetical protein